MDTPASPVASDRLRAEFVDLVAAEAIDEALRVSTDEIARSARVDTFVPLLAERRARERLLTLRQD